MKITEICPGKDDFNHLAFLATYEALCWKYLPWAAPAETQITGEKKDSLKRALGARASEMSAGRVLDGWRAGKMSRNVVPERTRNVKVSTWAFEERKRYRSQLGWVEMVLFFLRLKGECFQKLEAKTLKHCTRTAWKCSCHLYFVAHFLIDKDALAIESTFLDYYSVVLLETGSWLCNSAGPVRQYVDQANFELRGPTRFCLPRTGIQSHKDNI